MKRSLWRRLRWIAALLATAVGLLIVRTACTGSRQRPLPKAAFALPKIDSRAAAQRLAKALTFKTVCNSSEYDLAEFTGLHSHLDRAFPLVRQKLERFQPAPPSLLYRWPGKNPGASPVLLLSHLDVVPVSREEVDRERAKGKYWEHDPWSGAIAEEHGVEYVWGRGALDVKCGVLSMLEAVELLLAEGFQPEVDVYLAFGHDEETGGEQGARLMARWLAANQLKGRQFQFVLDEGGGIIRDVMPGLERPLGLVATAEKGYATAELTVTMTPGHSSMPPPHTAIGVLAAAVVRLENNPMPASFAGDNPTGAMLDVVAGDAAWPHKLAFVNRDVLAPLLLSQFGQAPSLNAIVRTTTSVNVIRGGATENVQPPSATANVNFRIHPNDTLDEVMAHVRSIVNDESVQIQFKEGARPATPVSSTDCAAYRLLEDAVHALDPAIVVAPGLSVVATDSRHYEEVAQPGRTYRFLPIRFDAKNDDLKRIHGVNERISVENYRKMIEFMIVLLRSLRVE